FLFDYIRDHPLEFRFLHSLSQYLWTKIEFVIAEGRIVETERVPGVDHLRAFVGDRLDGRRNGVAREEKKCVPRLFLDGFFQSQHTREAAARTLIDRGKLVDVVHLQKRHAYVAISFLLGE